MRGTNRNAIRVLVSLETLAFLAVGGYGLLPPKALPAAAGARDFSAGRALDHVTRIAQEPHPMGSPANARVRDHIVRQLEELGLEPVLQTIRVPDYYGDPTDTLTLVNVAAVLPGEDPTGAVALMEHCDTVPTTPGANDDSAAVAAILETARALRAGPPLRNDVILLFTDGEEPAPRYGASAFVEQSPLARRIRLIVNFEAVGSAGPSTLIEIGGPGSWVVAELAEAVQHPVMFS
ncbi:MAG: M20/M25/M40 family metallo-hydrolase [Actinomycetota bacterium]